VIRGFATPSKLRKKTGGGNGSERVQGESTDLSKKRLNPRASVKVRRTRETRRHLTPCPGRGERMDGGQRRGKQEEKGFYTEKVLLKTQKGKASHRTCQKKDDLSLKNTPKVVV